MRIPITAMRNHLLWTHSGTVWATWRLQGLAKGLGNSKINEQRRSLHRALFQSLHGEYMLLGLTTTVSSDEIGERMLDGVDILQHPAWAEETILTVDQLDAEPLEQREFWLSVPLKAGGVKAIAGRMGRRFEHSARQRLALPLRPPTREETAAAWRAALKVEKAIPELFKPSRATTAEQVWIQNHANVRGLFANDPVPPAAAELTGGTGDRARVDTTRTTAPSAVSVPWLDEGGQTDHNSKLGRFNPLNRRYLKVRDLRADTTGYQVLMALAGSPKGGWEEDLDWVGAIDELGVAADWVFRIHAVKAREAKHRNSRTEANLTDQMDQQEGTAAITGSGGELDVNARDLAEYHKRLGDSEREVEIQASLIVAVGGATADEAKERADFTRKYFSDALEFHFDIPLGGQENLWWAMRPGTPADRSVREYAEIATGADFATMAPATTSDLGDNKGIRFAVTALGRLVMLDLWGQIIGDISGSVGLVGEPGGGKTVVVKDTLGFVHDRGGRFVTIDRTQSREYGRFALSLDPLHTAIVDLTEPEYSLDPLRIFGARTGAAHMLTLCTALLGVDVVSPEGVMLAELLSPDSAERLELTSAGRLRAHLQTLAEDRKEATTLAGLMRLYSTTQFGDVLFDEKLPPLDLTCRGIVFLTHGVSLPSRSQLVSGNQYRKPGPEKLFGQAMYALLVRIAREICFRDPNELAVFAADELAHITATEQGDEEITEFLRDGRKHGAPVILASQDARDLGNEIARGLIKNRILMRQTDPDLAIANLEWFHKGFGQDPELVRIVTEDLSPVGTDGKVPENRRGEGLMRDARGRMGKIRKTTSLRPERREATLSTPKVQEPSEAPPRLTPSASPRRARQKEAV